MSAKTSFFLAALGLAASAGLSAAQESSYRLDPNAPMKFSADGQVIDPNTCVQKLSGRADFQQDRTRLRANEVSLVQAKTRGSCGDVVRLEARGDVFFVTPDRTVRADTAVYEESGKLVTFTGRVVSVQGKNVSVADRIVFNTDTNAATMSGNVQTVYYPEQDEGPFRTGDANRDSRLDRAEFGVALDARRAAGQSQTTQAAARPALTPAPANDAAAQFTRYDVNRDGYISLDEWKYPPSGTPAR